MIDYVERLLRRFPVAVFFLFFGACGVAGVVKKCCTTR
jgi:hypothetical protein